MKSNKLSKNVLKEIVKECLIEILAEGLVSKNSQTVSSKKSRTLKESIINSSEGSAKSKNRSTKRPSYLDSISFGDKSENKNMVKNENLDQIASNVTSDPILSEMLRDTAHTTLQEQISAESKRNFVAPGQGDSAQQAVANSEPSELFGEASNKWATLAFGS